jgi:uncharacterized protein YbbK (DUF523 family)
MGSRVLICACLVGIGCRYDGQPAAERLDRGTMEGRGHCFVPVCPEQLGGLPTPRAPVEIQGGDGRDVLGGRARVASEAGEDFTEALVRGAEAVLEIGRLVGAGRMITQARSPSCSAGGIYDGSFSGRLREGYGVCAALLAREGVEVVGVEAFLAEGGRKLEEKECM